MKLPLALPPAISWRGLLDDHDKGLSPFFLRKCCSHSLGMLFAHSQGNLCSDVGDIAVPCQLLTTQARSSMAQGDQFKIANTAYLNTLEANLS